MAPGLGWKLSPAWGTLTEKGECDICPLAGGFWQQGALPGCLLPCGSALPCWVVLKAQGSVAPVATKHCHYPNGLGAGASIPPPPAVAGAGCPHVPTP